MGLIPTEMTLCNKLVADYDSLIAPVKAARNIIRTRMFELESFLRSMTFSPQSILDAALLDFENRVLDIIPGDSLLDIQRILNFIERCAFYENVPPASIINGTIAGIFDNIGDIIEDIGLPEFGAGSIADAINTVMNGIGMPGGDNLTDIMQNADKLLNCLDSICALEDPFYQDKVTSITNDLDVLYSDMGLIYDGDTRGSFDFDAVYARVGLDSNQQGAINSVKGSFQTQKNDALTAVNNSIDAIKNAQKTAGGVLDGII
jgi:hypothetical protein